MANMDTTCPGNAIPEVINLPIPQNISVFVTTGTNASYAAAGFPALVRELSFLNTLDTADALRTLSRSPHGSLGATHHLTIYDGAWPVVDSQEEWAGHFLFLSRGYNPTHVAYHRYEQFIRQEASRTFDMDVHLFRTVLAHFPSLRELTLSHIHAWRMRYLSHTHFRNLTNSIWVTPAFENFVANAMSRLLPALGTSSRLQRQNGLEDSIAKFLGAFPGLNTLSIRTFPRGPIYQQLLPLSQMQWSDLQYCHIVGTWERHTLKRLTLKQVTLTDGFWKSFFSKARDLRPRPDILCQGILHKRDSQGWLMEDLESQRLPDRFLTHAEFPWPFSDPDDDISMFSLSH
ncbi:hypothetical protein N657DRAFT_665529 [Parathielavia appendiculata]|uniref:Uncharacterized protein n=1 Tax=Parathielavia appendiculata TaxID=2587402 RepID=A0AAN6TV52_9PEZI|nr:hypothetical protein N657DRAFT_665529 [Parathielavia appendiculata]